MAATSVGEMEATLRLRDEMTAELRRIKASVAETAQDIAVAFEGAATGVAHYERAIRELSGIDVVSQANAYAEALKAIGGASALTTSEQARVNDVLTEAIAKYEALGAEVPQSLRDLADATKDTATATQTYQKALNELSGTDVIAQANAYAQAVQEVGGASKLTAQEQAKVNAVVTEAVAKYEALGQEAPAALRELADATKDTSSATQSYKRALDELSGSGVIDQANAYAQALNEVGGASKLTAEEQVKVNEAVTAAIEKYEALGQEAPQALRDVAAATEQAQTPTQRLSSFLSDLGQSIKATALGFITAEAAIALFKAAVKAVTDFVISSIESFSDQEVATRRLTAAITAQTVALGGQLNMVPRVADQYAELADHFQSTTVFADELVAEMQTLLVTIGNVMPRDMDNALKAAMNLSIMFGGDLRAATMAVAKAAEGMTTPLKRAGIVIDEVQARAKGLPYILEQINSKFRGQAVAEVNTYAGALKQLANQWDEVKEAIGGLVATHPLVLTALRLTNDLLSELTAKAESASFKVQFLSGVLSAIPGFTPLDQMVGSLLQVENAAAKAAKQMAELKRMLEKSGATRTLTPEELGVDQQRKIDAYRDRLRLLKEEAQSVPPALRQLVIEAHRLGDASNIPEGVLSQATVKKFIEELEEAERRAQKLDIGRAVRESLEELDAKVNVMRKSGASMSTIIRQIGEEAAQASRDALAFGETASMSINEVADAWRNSRVAEAVKDLRIEISALINQSISDYGEKVRSVLADTTEGWVENSKAIKASEERVRELTRSFGANTLTNRLAAVSEEFRKQRAAITLTQRGAENYGERIKQLSKEEIAARGQVYQEWLRGGELLETELEDLAADAMRRFEEMRKSGVFSADALARAWRTAFELQKVTAKGFMADVRRAIELVDALGQSVIDLGENIGGSFGDAAVFMGQLVSQFARAQKAGEGIQEAFQSGKTFEGLVRSADAAINAINAVWAATSGEMGKGEGALKGALSGAAAGSAFGPWGTVIGAIGGAIVGLVRGMTDFEKEAKAAGRTFDALRDQLLETFGTDVLKSFTVEQRNAIDALAKMGAPIDVISQRTGIAEHAIREYQAAWEDAKVNIRQAAAAVGLAFDEEILSRMASGDDVFGKSAAMQEFFADLEERTARLNEALDKYKISWMDLGDVARQARVDQVAEELLKDFTVLSQAGVATTSSVRGMSGSLNQLINDALRAGTQIPANMRPIIEQLIQMGLLTEENRRLMLGLADAGGPSFAEVTEAAQRYGIELDALGPKIAQLHIDEQAAQIVEDFELLVAAGADVGAVLNGMSDEVQGLVDSALKFGAELPSTMKPLIDQLIQAGLLTDETGEKLENASRIKFAEPLEASVDRLIAKLDELIAKITDGVGGAIDGIAGKPIAPPVGGGTRTRPPSADVDEAPEEARWRAFQATATKATDAVVAGLNEVVAATNRASLATGGYTDQLQVASDTNFTDTAVDSARLIPEAWKPIIEAIRNAIGATDDWSGDLTDIGDLNFSDPVLEEVRRLIEQMMNLGDTIRHEVGGALDEISDRPWLVKIGVEGPEIPEGERWGMFQQEVPQFRYGTGGSFLDFGEGTMVELHGKERVQTEGEAEAESVQPSVAIYIQNHYGTVDRQFVDGLLNQLAPGGPLYTKARRILR